MSKIYMATKDDVTRIANKLAASWEGDLDAAYVAIAHAGGTVPATKTIAGLATAIATIPGDRLTKYISNDSDGYFVNSDADNIRDYAFYMSTAKSVVFPNCTTVGVRSFCGCDANSVYFPSVTNIKSYAFAGCSFLRTASFPRLTSCGDSPFRNSDTNPDKASGIENLDLGLLVGSGSGQWLRGMVKLRRLTIKYCNDFRNHDIADGPTFRDCPDGEGVIDCSIGMTTDMLLSTQSSLLSAPYVRSKVHIWCSDGWAAWDATTSSWLVHAYPDPAHTDSPTA